jgi:hypothetical protein
MLRNIHARIFRWLNFPVESITKRSSADSFTTGMGDSQAKNTVLHQKFVKTYADNSIKAE